MRLLDVASLYAAAEIASKLYFNVRIGALATIYEVILVTCSVIVIFIFSKLDFYGSWRGLSMVKIFMTLISVWAGVLLSGIILSFFLHRAGELSRLWLMYWFIWGSFLLTGYRSVVHIALGFLRRKCSFNVKHVLLVGYGDVGREMQRRAAVQDWFGYKIVALHDVSKEEGDLVDPGIFLIKDVNDVKKYVESRRIDEVWITLPMAESDKLRSLVWLLRNSLVDIRYVPDTFSIRILNSKLDDFLGLPTVFLNRPRYEGIDVLGKEIIDRILALAGLIACAPLFATLAVLIKMSSPGPVFFRQERHGLDGRVFRIYKFRSMVLHKEFEGDGVRQAVKGDPRVTAIGDFIRRTSLDELPQLINVLKGEMSIVGPRPHAVQHNRKYADIIELYMVRHRMKPGITGWAQIHGLRGETDTVEKMAERVRFDLHYMQNWSLLLDLKIIAWTALKGWTGKHAY